MPLTSPLPPHPLRAVFTTSAPSFAPATAPRVSTRGVKATAAAWACGSGALVADAVYDGCTWDARYETLGWDQPGYNTTGWLPAT